METQQKQRKRKRLKLIEKIIFTERGRIVEFEKYNGNGKTNEIHIRKS
jgi:hypothetical protein